MDLEKQHRIVQKILITLLALLAIGVLIYAISLVIRINNDYQDINPLFWFITILWLSMAFLLLLHFEKRHNNLKHTQGHTLSNPTGSEAAIAYYFFTGILVALTKDIWQPILLGS